MGTLDSFHAFLLVVLGTSIPLLLFSLFVVYMVHRQHEAEAKARETLIYAIEHSETAEYIPTFPQSVLTLIDKPATSEQVKGRSVGMAGLRNYIPKTRHSAICIE